MRRIAFCLARNRLAWVWIGMAAAQRSRTPARWMGSLIWPRRDSIWTDEREWADVVRGGRHERKVTKQRIPGTENDEHGNGDGENRVKLTL